MKKYIIAIIFAIGFGMSLNAQGDAFFTYQNYSDTREDFIEWGDENSMPVLPSAHGTLIDYSSAPLGSGLLLLAGLGLGYATLRKKD